MMKKKITYKEWTDLGKYNYGAKWIRPLCSYHLLKDDNGRFKREQRMPLWFYLLIFIPVHIAQAFYCMWNGGLKEFEFADRYLGGDYLGWADSPDAEKARKIWEKA